MVIVHIDYAMNLERKQRQKTGREEGWSLQGETLQSIRGALFEQGYIHIAFDSCRIMRGEGGG